VSRMPSIRICCHEATHDEAVDPLMKLFGQFQKDYSRKPVCIHSHTCTVPGRMVFGTFVQRASEKAHSRKLGCA
jgi:hypothetical protein